ncbi:hypothetical protein HMPREF1981_01071 [Bacteroides pyogenes F0041]|uniref:Uncharacterized protein n=3 Tax=Bacteroides pyogenes TaxID=310300 RepID=U2C703_9BACE|nr:hypothetical protein HMPREF1981_01071 [Bacteroides pyogenes F0041]GAE14542.1 hypothetical protein JCM6292_695 [Bacteroides pyogenes JCM 6292]GAE18286.1 hypothetical protein JCM6294_1162 [Bacteroides pyogenes DSM 20611 = JCM 6294]
MSKPESLPFNARKLSGSSSLISRWSAFLLPPSFRHAGRIMQTCIVRPPATACSFLNTK